MPFSCHHTVNEYRIKLVYSNHLVFRDQDEKLGELKDVFPYRINKPYFHFLS